MASQFTGPFLSSFRLSLLPLPSHPLSTRHFPARIGANRAGVAIEKTWTGTSAGGPITSSAEGGCPDLDPFHGSGCGAKLICNRLARLAKTVRLLAPLIAVVRCHSPSSRTKQVHLRLERASPAAQPTSPRHKRSRSSSIGSRVAALLEASRRSDHGCTAVLLAGMNRLT